MNSQHISNSGPRNRFAFGENWSRFLRLLTDERIRDAERSLQDMLGIADLHGKRFLDIGSGSGLFSLAARRLGATVHSFDFDAESVACTHEMKRRYFPNDSNWTIERASVLDAEYMAALGQFDVVYSWGVLHHTGQMTEAFMLAGSRTAPGGSLFIAIYNDQGIISGYWMHVKKAYNSSAIGQVLVTAIHAPYLLGVRWLVRTATGRRLNRGMSLWYDMFDWLGGYPFECAKPETVFQAFHSQGFDLVQLKTCGGRMGCNEFVFQRPMK